MADQNFKSDADKKPSEEKIKQGIPVEKKEEKGNDLNIKNEEIKKIAEEWKGKYLRALADYQNLERRVAGQREQERKFAAQRIMLRVLDILDIFDAAEKHSKDTHFLIGVNALSQFLKEEGVEKIEVLGKKFDPMIMECVEISGEGDQTVIEELRGGYRMYGKVIRVARVKVGKKI